MVKLILISWRDIPSQVIVQRGRQREKAMLSQRFQELIDLVAMKKKLAGTDAYLEQWNKGPRTDRNGSAGEVVQAVAAELEADFDTIRTDAIAKCGEG